MSYYLHKTVLRKLCLAIWTGRTNTNIEREITIL